MTLKDFKQVEYNKKMQDVALALIAMKEKNIVFDLLDCYTKPSRNKITAYKECREFYYTMLKDKTDSYYTKMQVYSYTRWIFIIAFIIDNKLFYITKDKKIYCEMGA